MLPNRLHFLVRLFRRFSEISSIASLCLLYSTYLIIDVLTIVSRVSLMNNKKNTNLFAAAVMPISMKPNLIVENYEILDKKRGFKR